jgi:hypothetical protein
MKFTFKTRDEYLAYKEDWKKRYFTTIQEIRASALERRGAEQALSKNVSNLTLHQQTLARRKHFSLKDQATSLIAERWDSKREAGVQRKLRLGEECTST